MRPPAEPRNVCAAEPHGDPTQFWVNGEVRCVRHQPGEQEPLAGFHLHGGWRQLNHQGAQGSA